MVRHGLFTAGGIFDLDLFDPTDTVVAHEIILAASYRSGVSLAKVESFEPLNITGRTSKSKTLTGSGRK